MIQPILRGIKEKVNTYLIEQSSSFNLIIGDIAQRDKDNGFNAPIGANNLVLTLMNIEEESIFKNNTPKEYIGSTVQERNPVLYLNLYLLFSANFEQYDEALKHITYVLEFFQINKDTFNIVVGSETIGVKCHLHNINFENLHNVWMVFGGHYLPSVIYKLKIVAIQKSPSKGAEVILNIEETEKII